MRLAFPGSVVLHGCIAALAVGFVSLTPPSPLPAAEVVSVDIITTHSFSTNATETIESDATISARSAGGKPVELASIEPIEPNPTRQIVREPVVSPPMPTEARSETATLEPVAKPLEPNPREIVEPIAGLSVLAASVQAIEPDAPAVPLTKPMEIAALTPAAAPIEAVDPLADTAPVPMPRLANRPDRVQKKSAAKLKKTTKKAAPKKKPTHTASRGGNNGAGNADSRASAAQSSAAISNYSGKVVSKLRRALRFPKGARRSGEVHVSFVVAANGRASSIRIVRSSGDSKLDAAAVATVKRAAPFPAIPSGAGRRSWAFTVPLAFRR